MSEWVKPTPAVVSYNSGVSKVVRAPPGSAAPPADVIDVPVEELDLSQLAELAKRMIDRTPPYARHDGSGTLRAFVVIRPSRQSAMRWQRAFGRAVHDRLRAYVDYPGRCQRFPRDEKLSANPYVITVWG
jgi:hypothetical protein